MAGFLGGIVYDNRLLADDHVPGEVTSVSHRQGIKQSESESKSITGSAGGPPASGEGEPLPCLIA